MGAAAVLAVPVAAVALLLVCVGLACARRRRAEPARRAPVRDELEDFPMLAEELDAIPMQGIAVSDDAFASAQVIDDATEGFAVATVLEEWACDTCTALNRPGAQRCHICEAPRARGSPPVMGVEPSAPAAPASPMGAAPESVVV